MLFRPLERLDDILPSNIHPRSQSNTASMRFAARVCR
jgi:hypothetical protein